MTQMNTMDTKFAVLTEEELMTVDGGVADWVIYGSIAVGALALGWWLGK